MERVHDWWWKELKGKQICPHTLARLISLRALPKHRTPVKRAEISLEAIEQAEVSRRAILLHTKFAVEVALLHVAALACCGVEDMASMFRGIGRLDFISITPNNGFTTQDLRCTDAD